MLKKTVTYEDFNGEGVTEDLFFNLTQAELIELEMSVDGGFSDTLTKMMETDPEGKVNGKFIMEQMKSILIKSYGVKSPDGRRFIKNDQLRQEFESSEAYSTIFVELVTQADAASNFINGVIPAALQAEVAKMTDEDKSRLVNVKAVPDPEVRLVTRAHIVGMSDSEMQRVMEDVKAGRARLAE